MKISVKVKGSQEMHQFTAIYLERNGQTYIWWVFNEPWEEMEWKG